MSESSLAPTRAWLANPMDRDVSEAIERLRRPPDIQQIAVMPDVHLSAGVCIGTVIATSNLIYPQAVGGDIGCGMLAVATDAEAASLAVPRLAGEVLSGLGKAVPPRRRNRRTLVSQPASLTQEPLSDTSLESVRRTEGAIEFATLGSGNHFIELQADEEGRLWLMVHSGSRAVGQAIHNHHLAGAQPVGLGLRVLEAQSDSGVAYLHDLEHARSFADASRKAMAEEVGRVLSKSLGARLCWETAITTDHNHVARESHGGRELWVHRKGAMPAGPGQPGVLPGSMGTLSFHVDGRGHEASLRSSAHGAGRALSRSAAAGKVSERELRRQMEGVWYDFRLSRELREEAPSAYKDIRAVLRAQQELVKVTRTLRPVLNYKGV
ncbi:MAG TPA: RtcB family protein [Bryobacteraceae bacterium]|nr:RtcB family protein [Bryobacteraceae bacterium]